jgi:hypothetical protein
MGHLLESHGKATYNSSDLLWWRICGTAPLEYAYHEVHWTARPLLHLHTRLHTAIATLLSLCRFYDGSGRYVDAFGDSQLDHPDMDR